MSKRRNPVNIGQRMYFVEARTGLPRAIAAADLRSTSRKGLERISRVEYRELVKRQRYAPKVTMPLVTVPPMPKASALDSLLRNVARQVLSKPKFAGGLHVSVNQ